VTPPSPYRPFPLSVVAAIIVGILFMACAGFVPMAFWWAGKKAGDARIDPSPRAWGSSPKLSTVAGFLEGRWRMTVDRSTARSKNDLVMGFTDNFMAAEMGFAPNRTGWYSGLGGRVEFEWREEADGIRLKATSAGGFPPERVRRAEEEWRNVSDRRGRPEPPEVQAAHALFIVDRFGRLTLSEDGKSLRQRTNSERADGSTFMGTPVWRRER
jgi:hypothetical protein